MYFVLHNYFLIFFKIHKKSKKIQNKQFCQKINLFKSNKQISLSSRHSNKDTDKTKAKNNSYMDLWKHAKTETK